MKQMQNLSMSKKWWILVGISLSSFLGCIDFTIVNTGLPSIQTDLHASVNQLQWIINIFLLALSAFMVIKGRLGDLYGRRLVLYIGMLLFGVSSLGAGLSPSINWLIFFRFTPGMGVAILYTVPVAIVANVFPTHLRGRATSILFGVNGFGLAVGPVVGGLIIGALSWRWIFFVNIPIIIISFLICLRTLPESKIAKAMDSSRLTHHQEQHIDWLGFILLAIAFPLLILTTVEGSNWGWQSPLVLISYAIVIVSLFAFYFVEKHSKSPIIQLELFANRLFICGAIANFLLAFFYTVAFFILPLYLHNIMQQNSYQIGLTLLPATIMVAVLSPVVGHTIEKYGVKKNLVFGFILFAISAYLQTYFSTETHLMFVITALVILGIGWAFILSPTFIAALSSLPESMSGVATGTIGTLHNVGGAIGLALGTLLYHYEAKHMLLQNISQKLGGANTTWIEKAISHPENAITIISNATGLDTTSATHMFIGFFNHSFISLMWLLVAASIIGLIVVLVGLKEQN